MNATSIRLVSLLLFALLCAVATYWVVQLTARAAPVAAASARPPLSAAAAAELFGGTPADAHDDVQLAGVLNFGLRRAAAIVSIDGQPPRAVAVGATLSNHVTLSEVRARSIVIDANGAKREIFLPVDGSGPTIYVR